MKPSKKKKIVKLEVTYPIPVDLIYDIKIAINLIGPRNSMKQVTLLCWLITIIFKFLLHPQQNLSSENKQP